MTPLIFILALYLEPVGTITDEPYDFVQGVEEIPMIELEDLEREMER